MSLPSLPALQQLYHLNRSSPDFHDQLCSVIYGEEYRESVPNLQGEDLVCLVDYLDEVRRHISPPRSLLKQTQVLGRLNPSSATSRKCQRELRTICGARGILPTSYTISSYLLNICDPFAAGEHGDVYEGTLDGVRVCVKRVRVDQGGSQRTSKVCY